MNVDRSIAACVLEARCRRPWLDRLADFVARYVILLLLFAAVALTGAAPLVAILVAWPLCVGLEILIHRPRPFQALHRAPLAKYWTPTPSFPSAHATLSFALAGAAWFHEPRTWPLFLAAASVAAARVYVGVHYLSDVAAGALIGFGVSFALHWFV